MPEDLYSLWLHVPPGPRPPDYYGLLGIPRGCADPAAIEAAARRQLDRLDRHALASDPARREGCHRLMNEVARARLTLANPERRRAYDQTLAAPPQSPLAAVPARAVPAPPVIPILPAPERPVPSIPPAPGVRPTPPGAPMPRVPLPPAPFMVESDPAEAADTGDQTGEDLEHLAAVAAATSPRRRARSGPSLAVWLPAAVLCLAACAGAFLAYRAYRARLASVVAAPTLPGPAPGSPSVRPAARPATTGAGSTLPATNPAATGGPAEPVAFTQDQVRGDLTLSATDAPYQFTGTISPPDGAGNWNVTVGPGVEIRGGALDLRRIGHLRIAGTAQRPAVLRGVSIFQDYGADANASFAVFDACSFAKGGAWYQRYSSKWQFDSCLLYRSTFPRLTEVDYGFKLTQCTFVSMRFPEIEHGAKPDRSFDHMNWLRKDWNVIDHCRFVDCMVPPTVFWCSQFSDFGSCSFPGGETFESGQPTEAVGWVKDPLGPWPDRRDSAYDHNRAKIEVHYADAPFGVFSFPGELPIPALNGRHLERAAAIAAPRRPGAATTVPADPISLDFDARDASSGDPNYRKSIIFVCDASGVMVGKYDAMTAELRKAIANMRPSYRYQVYLFHDGTYTSAGNDDSDRSPQPATPPNNERAMSVMTDVRPGGVTDPTQALGQALYQQPQLVYFLVGGPVADVQGLREMIHRVDPDHHTRINTICFRDESPTDQQLLKQVAAESRGVYRFASPPDAGEGHD